MPVTICVVGSSNMDLIARVPRMPGPGETVMGTSFLTVCGGKGGNQAVMAARLGARVNLVGRVGKDVFGEQLLANYRREGIDTKYVVADRNHPTGVASILVNEEGENRIAVVPGANAALTAEDVINATDAIRTADYLLCQFEVPPEAILKALHIARGSGVNVVLNPAPFRPIPREWYGYFDYLVLNEDELQRAARTSVESNDEIEKAATRLWNRTGATVVVTLGSRGVLCHSGVGPEWIDPVAVRVVDTTGAGDAFVAAFAVSMAGAVPLSRALQRANALAAFTVTRPGTQSSYPTKKEAREVLRRHGLTRRG